MDTENDARFSGMPQLRKERSPVQNYNLYDDRGIQSTFVDGLSEILLGSFVSKLTFHITSSVDKEDGTGNLLESRVVRARLTIPTTVLMEMAVNIQSLLAQNAAALEPQAQQALKSLRDLIAAEKK